MAVAIVILHSRRTTQRWTHAVGYQQQNACCWSNRQNFEWSTRQNYLCNVKQNWWWNNCCRASISFVRLDLNLNLNGKIVKLKQFISASTINKRLGAKLLLCSFASPSLSAIAFCPHEECYLPPWISSRKSPETPFLKAKCPSKGNCPNKCRHLWTRTQRGSYKLAYYFSCYSHSNSNLAS